MPPFFLTLQEAISSARLSSYYVDGDTDHKLVARYVWNICLCESFYAPFQHLEITLRNSLYDNIANFKGDAQWLNENSLWLTEDRIEEIRMAKSKLARIGKPETTGHVIAELPFAFWTGLLGSEYEQVLWPRLVVKVFPNFPPNRRARQVLSNRLNQIRHLRNSFFHPEPIWDRPRLKDEYDEILEAIGWLNKPMLAITRACESFSYVSSVEQLADLESAIEPLFK